MKKGQKGHFHWNARRKAEILDFLDRGVLSVEEAIAHYATSIEELDAWRRQRAAHGVPGLRATRIQIYSPERRRSPKRWYWQDKVKRGLFLTGLR